MAIETATRQDTAQVVQVPPEQQAQGEIFVEADSSQGDRIARSLPLTYINIHYYDLLRAYIEKFGHTPDFND